MKQRICIVGYGYVGKAMVAALSRSKEFTCSIVDPGYEQHNQPLVEVIRDCDAAIICVPTPQREDGSCDSTIVRDSVDTIGNQIPILIKSTTDIDTLGTFKSLYPNVTFSPEFLRGRHSIQDFLAEDKMIIGGIEDQCAYWIRIFEKCLNIQESIAIDIIEAGYVKYAENSFLATRVTFFNDLYNLMSVAHPELNYSRTVNALGLDPRIGHSHNQVPGYDGKFGWGGHCLPKDTSEFVAFAERNSSDLPLVREVRRINAKHRKRT